MRAMRLGPLTLASNLFLSPLAGYTNLPFRLTVRELGGLGLATTDLVNARSLLEKKAKALKLIETSPADQPLAVQLFGSVPEEMRDAAAYLESLGVASVDINMGCPVRKVCRIGGGSAMMTELDKTARLVKGMVDAVKIPVTAKMRLGWDDENITAPDLARALEDVGRGRHLRSWPHARAGLLRHGQPGRHPRRGAGAEDRARHRQWGCHHPAGREDDARPDRLRRREHRSRRILQSVDLPPHAGTIWRQASCCPNPPFDERVRVMCRHLDLMIEVFGEVHGCRMFRKVAPWYAKRFGPAKEFNQRVVLISSRAEFHEVLDGYRRWRAQFLDESGELQPRFRPPPMMASFMQEPGAAPCGQIAVPKGPVAVW